MNQRNLLISAGVGCFLVFVLALVPARIMASLVPTEVATLADMSGTLWNGNAQSIEVAGFQLREVNWELHPLALLIGRVSLTVDAKWGTGYIRGDVAAGLTGSLQVRDLQLAGPLAPVLRRMNLAGNSGELAVEIATLDIEEQWPTRLTGSVRVGQLPLSMLGVSGGTLGSYGLEFDIDEVAGDGVIPGVLSDNGGPLEMLGELRLTPPRNYAIQARIKARPDAPPDLAQGLMLVGPKLPDGGHEFQMTGSL